MFINCIFCQGNNYSKTVAVGAQSTLAQGQDTSIKSLGTAFPNTGIAEVWLL